MSNILPIWQGSASFSSGDTPFGYYDSDTAFQSDIEATAVWCGRRLGHGLSDVELQPEHFFAAFEEAVNEYGYIVNSFALTENLPYMLGLQYSTSSNLSQTFIPPNTNQIIKLSKHYGNHIPSGGDLTWYTGSIDMVAGKQVYDFVDDSVIETGSFMSDTFTIRKIFHQRVPTYNLSGYELNNFTYNEFGWLSTANVGQYMMSPIHYEILKLQANELTDEMYKSSYSFAITNNRLRIFPVPTEPFKLFFHYTLDNEGGVGDALNGSAPKDKVSDPSNAPYGTLIYANINHIGRNWIRRYTLAICKEILGYIRGKYSSVPIADGEVTLNADTLLSAASEEKSALTTELREFLDKNSQQNQLTKDQTKADALAGQLKYYPLKIYVR